MGIFSDGTGQKAQMKAYYDKLRTDRWQGNVRTTSTAGAPVPGKHVHLRKAGLLSGLYLLNRFRPTEPKLLTVARYGIAPILNTTELGKKLDAGLNVLRMGKKAGMTGTAYPDLPLDNPLERVANLLHSKKSTSKEILNKYGLHSERTSEHGMMMEHADGSVEYVEEEFKDLIPVKFKHVDPDGKQNTHQVRGSISGLSDTISPAWSEVTYVGRPDAMQTYGGFGREVTFDLTLAAMNERQLMPMWEKINRIATYVLPQIDPGQPITRYAGKLCNVTVGNYLTDELCAMTAFTITPNEEASWEIGDPYVDHPSLTLSEPILDKMRKFGIEKKNQVKANISSITGAFTGQKGSGKPLGYSSRRQRSKATPTPFIMPRIVTINIGLKVLHNNVPGDPRKQTPLFKIPRTNYGQEGTNLDPTGNVD